MVKTVRSTTLYPPRVPLANPGVWGVPGPPAQTLPPSASGLCSRRSCFPNSERTVPWSVGPSAPARPRHRLPPLSSLCPPPGCWDLGQGQCRKRLSPLAWAPRGGGCTPSHACERGHSEALHTWTQTFRRCHRGSRVGVGGRCPNSWGLLVRLWVGSRVPGPGSRTHHENILKRWAANRAHQRGCRLACGARGWRVGHSRVCARPSSPPCWARLEGHLCAQACAG